ncbi:GH32 C-terminal domain-containing protein [Streptomyces sp. NBC_01728]|uniref:glycoside hydrolase family 32 protein n=1 Tax=unclassified Streptomyces TaxID=2593676 RepID=UPI002253C6C0|nr:MULTISPECIES: glycoside hydrolase family 32 protein [unclassified Streptomyces]MCX4454795.1 GH32 C-terminal domain-containing protein [Streptomyces sp. NBC_01719]MCX4494155.1 GH32 C-terminal domain-containing protein [Streptomyces sp. NBC_01728]
MSVSRRTLLLAGGTAATLLPLGGILPAAQAATPSAAGATPAATPIPDPIPVTGTWTLTSDGGQKATAGRRGPALALSEQQLAAKGTYAARVTPQSSSAVGALVFRAALDGSTGYAVALDAGRARIRLYDLTGGDTLATAPLPGARTARPYDLEVAVDGPELTVHVDGKRLLHTEDHRHDTGSVGLLAQGGTVTFGPPSVSAVTTNLTGWTTSGGTWTATPLGWRADPSQGTTTRAVTTTQAYDTALQADLLLHDTSAVAELLVRTDEAATRGYGVQVDPGHSRLRLYRIDGNVTLGTYATAIEADAVYRLRVEAEGTELRVHWQTNFLSPDGYSPVITAQDSTHTTGRLAVRASAGAVSFENIAAADLVTSVQGWTARSGTWTPDLRGIRGENGLRTAPFTDGDLVARADITPAGTSSSAGLVLRASANGSGGYEARLEAGRNAVVLLDRSSGARLASASGPVRRIASGGTYRVEARATGRTIEVYVDGVRALKTRVSRTTGATVGTTAAHGASYFQNVEVRGTADYFTEPYRPTYHYSQLSGSTSDPNGLVHYDGEYHLFHQDQGRWAHAVSTDLVHWQPLPIALPWNEYGNCWSGSAIVDADDTSGLFDGGSGLIAYYTSYHPDKPGGNASVRIAYSKDKGRSWQWHGGSAPTIQNPGGPDAGWTFRDPKVIRDEAHDQWLMVVSGGDHVRFFTSTDLLTWTQVSSFGYGDWVTPGVWECPDFFPLRVDGDENRVKWVLTLSTGAVRATNGSAAQYFTGDWNGTSFSPDQSAGATLRADSGRDYYAAMSYYGLVDGRRVWLGWMSNWDYPFSAPTGAWNGQLSIPRELTLTDTADGVRLAQRPIPELSALRTSTTTRKDLSVSPESANPLAGVTGIAYEIEAEITLGTATEIGFKLRADDDQHTTVGYDAEANQLFVDRSEAGLSDFTQYFAGRTTAAMKPASGRVTLRVYVDSSSVEAFGADGQAAVTSLIFPSPAADSMAFYTKGGTAHIESLTVHRLEGTYRLVDQVKPLVATPTGGEFRSDLGNLTITPAGRWSTDSAGRTGTFDQDSNAISARTATDLDLTTLVRLGGPAPDTGGALSLLWRASSDGTNAYCLNIDPDLRVIRLVAKANGFFDDGAALARVPALVRRGTTYPVRILAQGDRIQVFLNGEQIINVTDTTYTNGHIGLNVFGGRAAYQDTYAKEL